MLISLEKLNKNFMFLDTPGNPTKFKKTVYLAASVVLGLLLSLIAHALIEMAYLGYMAGQGKAVTFYNGCALPLAFSIGLFILGGIGGFFLGRFWWRLVYVERVWAKKI